MAYKTINCEFSSYSNAYRYEFVCDSANDVADLPKCAPGSIAIVADKGGAIYMVNASGEWKEQ